MPQVGDKEFPYSQEGIRDAQDESRRSGRPVRARRGMSYRSVAKQQRSRAKAKQD